MKHIAHCIQEQEDTDVWWLWENGQFHCRISEAYLLLTMFINCDFAVVVKPSS